MYISADAAEVHTKCPADVHDLAEKTPSFMNQLKGQATNVHNLLSYGFTLHDRLEIDIK